jgi:hypothetical protein
LDCDKCRVSQDIPSKRIHGAFSFFRFGPENCSPVPLDGPDMWYLLEIRNKGMFRIGMYFFNKDGHSGHNRLRDYLIEVYPSPRQWTVEDFYED